MSRRGRPSGGYEEDFYERDRYHKGGRHEGYFEDDRDYRRRPPATLVRKSTNASVCETARDDGAMVVKTREREDVELRSREKPKGVEKESEEAANRRETSTREKRSRKKTDREESLNRGENRGRQSTQRDETSSNKRERSLPPWQEKVAWDERDTERDRALVRRRDRSTSSWDDERDEVAFRHRSRDRSREREWERNEFRRHSSPRGSSRSRYRIDERDDIIIRREEREGRRGRGVERNEVAFRRREDRSTSPESASSPERPVIVAPPIHQDIITHHRHIDHVVYSGERNGRYYETDLVIDRRERERDGSLPPLRRRHSPEADKVIVSRTVLRPKDREKERDYQSTLDERDVRDIQEEAEAYARRDSGHGTIGEAYNGATKDWTVIDVPPGTKRITLEGVGGGSQEITWERYNGVRRTKFIAEGEEFVPDKESQNGRIGRRYTGPKEKRERLWTEITKDLVVREAIERLGYEYDETEYFYYVFDYLRYDDIAELVELSEKIRRARRERICEINRERENLIPLPEIPEPPLPPAPRVPRMERPPLQW
ncbi:hypothetical protein T310_7377 [Rasamsonia emersonii CBS 393.64]|uniref:DUF8035 domain-containing protein n=1 Tax=Rasamsonia emersonii (strain ATCC 16479 / CBS 393.64 / IMI 116815) TaxID=1408163 RepID=A0A0F4YKQ1_RASE3|nr:hypothetical protein T310_7377 [Rasamsonia emersonii CBS 393.64]KKA18680.1 hypothetical protein T310_7377 [Rasamsonia emersonii CBS 393.64]